MDVLLLIAGIVFAVAGAHFLVDGGIAVAKRFGIPTLVIGATVVAFGTSTPELTVNISSALGGNTDLALGNVLGSNVFNICMIIGIVALMAPIKVSEDSKQKDLPMCLISAIAVGLAGNQLYFDHVKYHQLMLSDGLMFLLFFLVFMKYVWAEAASGQAHHATAKSKGGGSSQGPRALARAVQSPPSSQRHRRRASDHPATRRSVNNLLSDQS